MPIQGSEECLQKHKWHYALEIVHAKCITYPRELSLGLEGVLEITYFNTHPVQRLTGGLGAHYGRMA